MQNMPYFSIFHTFQDMEKIQMLVDNNWMKQMGGYGYIYVQIYRYYI